MHHVSHFHRGLLFARWSTSKKLGCAGFDVASELPRMIFELAHRGIEGVADGDIDVLVRLVLRAFLIHVHVVARHADVDADLVKLALVVMPVRRLDGDVAAHDALEKAVKLGGLLADDRLHGGRWVDVADADLQGVLHVSLLFHTQTNAPGSGASLDLVDHVVHTENIPGVPSKLLTRVNKKGSEDGGKRSIIGCK